MKKRLDVLLVEQGLPERRSPAQALVLAGRVPGHAKPDDQLHEAPALGLTEPARYLPRGADNLATSHGPFSLDPRGLV